MNIGFVCKEYIPSKRAGGIASYIYDMARGLTSAGHRVTVITASDDTRISSDTIEDCVRVIRLSGGDFFLSDVENGSKLKTLRCVYRFHSYRKEIEKKIKEVGNFDIVEVADFGAESLYLDKCGVPVVLRLHTPSFLDIPQLSQRNVPIWKLHRSLMPSAEKQILTRTKYISSCSRSLLELLHKIIDFNPSKTIVIYNPSKTLNGVRSKIKSSGRIEIFYAGTIVETKGVCELIDACLILRKKGLSIHLTMAGKGGRYAESLKMNKELDWIEFAGHLNREELTSLYESSDVCCFPSWWENMPMVCLEAMGAGAIVVGSTSGGMREIITDGENGFLASRKNSNELATKLLQAINLTPAQRKEMKRNAQKTICSHFSIEKIVSETIAFYNEVIEDYKINNAKF